jgi:hypothetical protein
LNGLERSGEPQSSLTENNKSNRRARDAFGNKSGDSVAIRLQSADEAGAGGNEGNAAAEKRSLFVQSRLIAAARVHAFRI